MATPREHKERGEPANPLLSPRDFELRGSNSEVFGRTPSIVEVAGAEVGGIAQWTTPPASGRPPQSRSAAAAAAIRRRLFVFGGSSGSRSRFDDVHVFDTTVWSWVAFPVKGTAPTGRAGHTMTCVGGDELWVFGGDAGGTQLNDMHVLHIDRGNWESVFVAGTPPSPRNNHSAVAWTNKIIFFGGYGNGQGVLNDVHVFDTTNDTWSTPVTRGKAPPPRCYHAAACIKKNQMVVFGGFDGVHRFADVHVLNLETWQWSKPSVTGQVPRGSSHHVFNAVGIDDRLFLFGGYDGLEQMNTVYRLEEIECKHSKREMMKGGAAQKWKWTVLETQGSPPQPRMWHACATMGRCLLVFGGWNSRVDLDDVCVLDTGETMLWMKAQSQNVGERLEGNVTGLGEIEADLEAQAVSKSLLEDLIRKRKEQLRKNAKLEQKLSEKLDMASNLRRMCRDLEKELEVVVDDQQRELKARVREIEQERAELHDQMAIVRRRLYHSEKTCHELMASKKERLSREKTDGRRVNLAHYMTKVCSNFHSIRTYIPLCADENFVLHGTRRCFYAKKAVFVTQYLDELEYLLFGFYSYEFTDRHTPEVLKNTAIVTQCEYLPFYVHWDTDGSRPFVAVFKGYLQFCAALGIRSVYVTVREQKKGKDEIFYGRNALMPEREVASRVRWVFLVAESMGATAEYLPGGLPLGSSTKYSPRRGDETSEDEEVASHLGTFTSTRLELPRGQDQEEPSPTITIDPLPPGVEPYVCIDLGHSLPELPVMDESEMRASPRGGKSRKKRMIPCDVTAPANAMPVSDVLLNSPAFPCHDLTTTAESTARLLGLWNVDYCSMEEKKERSGDSVGGTSGSSDCCVQ